MKEKLSREILLIRSQKRLCNLEMDNSKLLVDQFLENQNMHFKI